MLLSNIDWERNRKGQKERQIYNLFDLRMHDVVRFHNLFVTDHHWPYNWIDYNTKYVLRFTGSAYPYPQSKNPQQWKYNKCTNIPNGTYHLIALWWRRWSIFTVYMYLFQFPPHHTIPHYSRPHHTVYDDAKSLFIWNANKN